MTTTSAREAALEAALAERSASHAAVPRLAEPNADLSSDVISPGRRIELLADEFGIVRPADPDAVRLADALRLPVLRSADQQPAETTAESAADPLAGLTKKELLAIAAERGVEVDPKATNPAIREALAAAETTAESAAEEEG